MIKTLTIILDTSIFANPDSNHHFGKNPQEAWANFLEIAQKRQNINFLMPPTIYEELMKFMEIEPQPEKSLIIEKRPPASYQENMPALFIYEFIEEMRGRINKGLRIGEKFTRKALKGGEEETMIKSFRDEYRVALREGFLDSKGDFDLILLAKETHGQLATADQGLIKWAAKLGITCLNAEELTTLVSG